MTRALERGASIASLMKWIGIIGGLLSFGTAIYALAKSEGDLRERGRVAAEQYEAGNAQEAAGDYPSAWDSFARAATTAGTDGLFAKLLGGLDAQQRQIRAAQQDLAMKWVRTGQVPEGHEFSEIVDKVVNVLATGAVTSAGQRKADLLAHLGWAYFLKQRSGDTNLQPETQYREAVALDATNPYANVYWGHGILWNHGSLSDAADRFKAALATGRARADVRHFQLAALANVRSDDAEAAWWQVVSDMRKNGESLEASTRRDMYDKYSEALHDDRQMQRMLKALTPVEHIDLQRMLLQTNSLEPSSKWTLAAVLATTLEAAGRHDEALETWRSLRSELRSDPNSPLTDRANVAIKRLDVKRGHRDG
jgi:tetratricopeptide (TPR) repeat protein